MSDSEKSGSGTPDPAREPDAGRAPDPVNDAVKEDELSHATIRQRVLSGAALIAGRNVILLALAVVANAVLAHLLTPRDFGLIAFGSAILSFAGALSDGGLGSALVRSSVDVDAPTLRSVFGLELAIGISLFSVIALVALPFFGLAGQLTAVMALSLPLGAFVTPAMIMLERSLDFRTLARVEVLQAVAYYGYSVAAVALGLGVWGLATAAVVRTVSSVWLLFMVRRDLFFRPSLSLARIRPLLRFGFQFQANTFVTVIRDQGLNIGVALVAGTSALGIWTLARRLLELPFTLFQVLWRVSFPATSQLIKAGSDARSLIERGAKATAIGSGLILAGVAAAAPGFVPAVFGARWHEAGPVVSVSCAALVIGGPISVATAGYLYASGDSAGVLVATVVHSVIWLVVGLALLKPIGPVGLAVGLVIGSVADAVLLARATYRHVSVRLFRPIFRPTLAAYAAGGVGLILTIFEGRNLATGIGSGVIAVVVYVGLLLVFEPAETSQLSRMMLSMVGLGKGNKVALQDA